MGNKHLKEVKRLHQRNEEQGCIWRHEAGYGSYRDTKCHYRKQGFLATDGRTEMYNKDHRENAVRLRYASWDSKKETIVPRDSARSRFEKELDAASGNRKGAALAKFLKKFRNKFQNSLKWLEYHEEGWHHGHCERKHPVRGAPSPEPTFKPKDKDTSAHGAWYPYHHEYHHLIAVDALRQYVITDKNPRRRIKALLASGWNINKGENVLFLPTELSTANIVELPAHCPWDTPDHPDYSASLKKHLDATERALAQATKGKKPCVEEMKKVSQRLDAVAKKLLESIAGKGGGVLGAI